MPLTPETWLEEFTLNSTTAFAQFDTNVIQLSNSNMLVTWTSAADTGAGSPAGTDIVGRIFDLLGTPVSGEFLINTSVSSGAESSADIAPLPGGGFLSIYEGFDTTTMATSLYLQKYDAAGTSTDSLTVISDLLSSDPNYSNPRIAVASDTSALVVYVKEGEGSALDRDVVGHLYNPTTNTLGPEMSLIEFGTEDIGNPTITALSNGHFAIVASLDDGGDTELILHIINESGGVVLATTAVSGTSGDGDSDISPTITGLASTGFAMAWVNTDDDDTDIHYQFFSNTGVSGPGGEVTDIGVTDDASQPIIAALEDGGFVVMYIENALGELRGHRYDSTGGSIGTTFTISAGSGITNPSATILADGRFAVTFEGSDGELKMEILDSRDVANTTAPDNVGTIGDDVFTHSLDSDAYGWDGDDIITEGFGDPGNIYGGLGDDEIIISQAGGFGEIFDGGAGTDTLSFFEGGSPGDVIVNLASGVIEYPEFGGDNDSVTAIENVATGGGDDLVVGSSEANIIDGAEGDDDLRGGDGADTLTGDIGIDIIYGQGGDDLVSGGSGSDTLLGGLGTDDLDGGDGADTINGQGGDDTITGGLGADTLLGASGADDIDGGADNDDINGNGGADIIDGGDGDDMLNGAIGSDLINGGEGDDIISGGNQNDTIDGDAGNDTLNGDAGNDIVSGGGDDDTLIGASGQDTLNGDAGNDNLSGNAGGDDLFGGAGDDILDGGGGNDDLNGGTGADIFVANLGFRTDRIQDFEDGVDIIDFSGNSLANDITDVMSAATQFGTSVRIELNPNNILILENFDIADLDVSDFTF